MSLSVQDSFFTDLWHKNYHNMRIHAYHQLYDQSLVDDAVSEAFTRALEHLDRNHPNPGAWLTVTVNNVCFEMNAKELRQRDLQTLPPGQPDPGIGELLPSTLRLDDAELLTLYYAQERRLTDIAAYYQTTSNVLKKRLYRARQRLKALLMKRGS